MNIFRFKKILFSLISKEESFQILDLMNQLYKKNILDEELILNLIKAFVIIFYLDKTHFDNYKKLLVFFNNNIKFSRNFFGLIKKINFSNQVFISQKVIDRIIIVTNFYITKIVSIDNEKYLNLLYDIILIILELELSIELKINLYLYLLKYTIRNNFKNINVNNEINEIKKVIENFLNKKN
jgi:hypothetical protein